MKTTLNSNTKRRTSAHYLSLKSDSIFNWITSLLKHHSHVQTAPQALGLGSLKWNGVKQDKGSYFQNHSPPSPGRLLLQTDELPWEAGRFSQVRSSRSPCPTWEDLERALLSPRPCCTAQFQRRWQSSRLCVPPVQELRGWHSTSSLQGLLCRTPIFLCMVPAVTTPAFPCPARCVPHCHRGRGSGWAASRVPHEDTWWASPIWGLSRHSSLLPLYKACPIHGKSKAGSW